MARAGGGHARAGHRLLRHARRGRTGWLPATGLQAYRGRNWVTDHSNLWRGSVFAVVRRRPPRPQERTADHRHRRHDRLCRVARRHAQRRFRRASVVPVRRRLRFQRDPARRQQIGIGLVSRRPAGLGDGHSSGRPAAWRRAGGGDLACRGGGIELAHGVRGRRGGDARRRVRFRAGLPAARRGRLCRVQACGLELRRGRRIAAPVVDAQRHDRRARSGQRAIRHPDLADALSARPCPYRADARRLVSGAGASRPASLAASVLRPGAIAHRRGAFACCRCA